jgi:putative ABC transport system permease protein
MSLWKIAWRSIQQRSLSSSLTALSMALGVALVVTVLVVHSVVQESFTRGASGYHLVVGKKGSQLQLVLNTVYHLQDPIENIPYSYYKEFITSDGKPGRFANYVAVAIPYCLGDNYENFRVVGTIPDMFEKLEYSGGRKYEFEPGGRNFKLSGFFEAVIGSAVARKTGLKVGERFQPTHGLAEDGHKHDSFEVVGVLKPTGTANDRALFINMEGFYLLENHAKPVPKHDTDDHEHGHGEHDHAEAADKHADDHKHEKHEKHDTDATNQEPDGPRLTGPSTPNPQSSTAAHDEHSHADHEHEHADHDHEHAHDHEHHEPLPEEQREVTAVLVLAKNDLYAESLRTSINEGIEAQAASPIRVIADFFANMVSNIHRALLILAILIVVEGAIAVLVSIYNSMSERKREIAVMRALGAGRQSVMLVILLESILLAIGGGLAGVILGHGLISVLSPWLVEQTGVSLAFWQFEPLELVLIPALVVLASLAGFLPAMAAYRTDVAKALSASP